MHSSMPDVVPMSFIPTDADIANFVRGALKEMAPWIVLEVSAPRSRARSVLSSEVGSS